MQAYNSLFNSMGGVPSRVQVQRAPCGVRGLAPELESFFVHFHAAKGPKVKDLNDSLPQCPRHDQPLLLVSGGAAAQSAHA